MAGKNREPATDTKLRLLREASSFSFYQALKSLRALIAEEASRPLKSHEIDAFIHIRPDLTLQFPDTDVLSIEPNPHKQGGYIMTVSFLGLYGSSSPIPTFYTEDLLHEEADLSTMSRDFLDIINRAQYHLYQEARTKYKILPNLQKRESSEIRTRLFNLAGLFNRGAEQKFAHSYSYLRYLGLVLQSNHSAEGLQQFLSDFLDEPEVEIQQCIERRVAIPADQRFKLGERENQLGVNSHLGSEVTDRTGKFRIRIGPLSVEEFNNYLPGREGNTTIREAVGFYLHEPLSWELVLLLEGHDLETTRLGEGGFGYLGWNSWIFTEQMDDGLQAVMIE